MHADEAEAFGRVLKGRFEPAHLFFAERPFLDAIHIGHEGGELVRCRRFGIGLDVEHDVDHVAPGESVIIFVFAAALRIGLMVRPGKHGSADRSHELNALFWKFSTFSGPVSNERKMRAVRRKRTDLPPILRVG